jgi:5-methylcytosine-specific restriction endonuclease McrA
MFQGVIVGQTLTNWGIAGSREWGGDVKQRVYAKVVERDEGFCQDCDRKAANEVHHIVPKWMLPGKLKVKRDHPRNLICLCLQHHREARCQSARQRHLELLREKHGYEYPDYPFLNVLGEA